MGSAVVGAVESELVHERESRVREYPGPMHDDALRGVAGEVVHLIDPHTEADRVGVLSSLLAMFGVAVGRGPHFRVGADVHRANLFILTVGPTSSGRKGMAVGEARNVMRQIDESFERTRLSTGLSSGEGLIWAVRDAVTKHEAVKEKGRIIGYQDVVDDPGVDDKRLMPIESEFASTLRVAGRDGNTLSPTIRNAWDGHPLASMTKNSPARCAEPHIGMIAQITGDELKRLLGAGEIANGFLNRYMIFSVRRTKQLPHGGGRRPPELVYAIHQLKRALEIAKTIGEMERDTAARALWEDVYPLLTADRPGLLGALTGRAAAQVLRLQCIYALLDGTATIGVPHLRAALGVWDYSQRSAEFLFGDVLGDPIADFLLAQLRAAEPEGMTRTDIRDAFARNASKEQIDAALQMLAAQGLAFSDKRQTSGRPAEVWRATKAGGSTRGGPHWSLTSFLSSNGHSQNNAQSLHFSNDINDRTLISDTERSESSSSHDINDGTDQRGAA